MEFKITTFWKRIPVDFSPLTTSSNPLNEQCRDRIHQHRCCCAGRKALDPPQLTSPLLKLPPPIHSTSNVVAVYIGIDVAVQVARLWVLRSDALGMQRIPPLDSASITGVVHCGCFDCSDCFKELVRTRGMRTRLHTCFGTGIKPFMAPL